MAGRVGFTVAVPSQPERTIQPPAASEAPLPLSPAGAASRTSATTVQIQVLPLEQLEALADALLDFQGPADLASWLAAIS